LRANAARRRRPRARAARPAAARAEGGRRTCPMLTLHTHVYVHARWYDASCQQHRGFSPASVHMCMHACCKDRGARPHLVLAMTAIAGRPTPTRLRRRAPPAAAKASLTPESWIAAATEVLADHGIDSVRV